MLYIMHVAAEDEKQRRGYSYMYGQFVAGLNLDTVILSNITNSLDLCNVT